MNYQLFEGDCLNVLDTMESKSVHCCVTSPPYYGLRDYQVAVQIGQEKTPDEYVDKLVTVFRKVKRVLRDDGTLWLNLGDSYAGSGRGQGGASVLQNSNKGTHFRPKNSGDVPTGMKAKDLIGIPWMVAFALRKDGWYLRSDIVWHKPNPMPESVDDRPTKAHEYMFLLSKSANYYCDMEAIKERSLDGGGRRDDDPQSRKHFPTDLINGIRDRTKSYEFANKRSVWTVAAHPYAEAHFATYPPKLIEPCILAGSPVGGTVLDPFNGSGTTGQVALQQGRNYVGIELNPDYLEMTRRRLAKVEVQPLLIPVEALSCKYEALRLFEMNMN